MRVHLTAAVAATIAAALASGCGNSKTKDDKSGATRGPTPAQVADAASAKRVSTDAAPQPHAEGDCAAGKVTASVADRYECTVDEDCFTTCAWGAVNYRAMTLLEDNCDDGCASKGLQGKCVQSRCTTFDYQGKRVDGCNDIATPEDVCVDRAVADDANRCPSTEKLAPTWARFSCKKDDDCVTSCKYGAINRTWFDRLGPGCKDGCSSKGMHGKCVADRCVAFDYDDKRVDECTDKSAPEAICLPK